MSRIIVKNLPKGAKEEKLRELFSQKGEITDMCMKYTKDGVFRNFAFIGYKTSDSGNKAIKHFDKTFFNSTKMQVELAKDFGDKTKPRAWSKYSAESSVHQKNVKKKQKGEKQNEDQRKSIAEKKKHAKEEKMKEFLGDLGDDPEFKEFLEVHQNVTKKSSWSNDMAVSSRVTSPDKQMKKRNDVTFDESSDESDVSDDDDDDDNASDDVDEGSDNSDDEQKDQPKKNSKETMSDLQYLKSQMASSELLSDSSDSDSEEDRGQQEQKKTAKQKKKIDSSKGDKSDTKDVHRETARDEKQNVEKSRFVVKMRGLHGKYNEKMIKEFFKPLTTVSVKLPRNARKHLIGVAFVEFSSDKDLDQALRKNKNFINGKRIIMKRTQEESDLKVTENQPRAWELKIQQERTDEDEGIAETGRLFVRNLAYCCTEEELEELFKKYGPLTEVNVPIDKFTKKIKGYAHVTFMIPEHAVKAFIELDGTVFQGRMLHILPGKPKTEEMELTEKSSFKKKKEMEQKTLAKSSHNWNTLFLGANAVADAMAERYATSKSQILDAEGKESLGVRMALGETQIVSETRDFLIENGVSLDSFSQAAAPRSKTVILAKNLPAGTQEEELREKFEKFGTLGRLLLPPAGVSALIEFMEPAEARAAFTKLAYTKFHYLPLYLEWAPVGVFTSDYSPPKSEPSAEEVEPQGDEPMEEGPEEEREDGPEEKEENKVSESDSEEEESEPGCTLFVKNLNFDTTEEDLTKAFAKCGKIKYTSISKKKDLKNAGKMLSMGYGFVEYQKKSSADKALKTLQHVNLDGHQLELKISNRETRVSKETSRKKQKSSKQKSSKILVRNIPFEAQKKEIFELFRVFGELKTVRLPKKLSGTGSHRGFGFVDFLTRQDAKRAFNALCHSTHLYGRRLVLEWAEAEDTIEDLRKKTAERFHEDVPSKKLKKSSIIEELKSSG